VFKLLVLIKEAFLLSFATASSEAAYPKILDALDRFGVKRKISSFVCRWGIRSTSTARYVLHVRGAVHRAGLRHRAAARTQITMLLILMLTSKGMPACRAPRWW